ncbi:hypothetical protein DW649_07215 [Coprobacillus sp. AM23-2]|nr:hypothetical protein DW649_07215 [Coprobacillus sp. AM23-2]
MIHNYSLIIIKYKNKYLLYDDQRWKCKLFINYKTVNKDNEQHLINFISKNLEIDISLISYKYITSKIQRKYSISHNEYKTYNHSLYLVTLSFLQTIIINNDFIIKNKHYYWMTMNMISNDKSIKEKNL